MANLQNTIIDGGITEKIGTSTVSGTTVTIDLNTGNFFELDFTSASGTIATFTITKPALTSTTVSTFVLKIQQGITARDFNWGSLSAFKWNGGTAPALSTLYENIDFLSFTTWDNGTTWYGSEIGGDFPREFNDSRYDLFGARGVWGGGSHDSGNEVRIDYITIATPGNATTFGDLSAGHNRNIAGTSNGVRGVFAGNFGSVNTIDYITIASTGNATDFGDLTQGRGTMAAVSDGVRGVFASGTPGSNPGDIVNTIDYITIATTGNATRWGAALQTVGREGMGAVSDGERGVFAGGASSAGASTTIDYITISTPSMSTNFGVLTAWRRHLGGASDGSRGVFGGGHATAKDRLEYITISTAADAVYFGNLTQSNYQVGCASTSNGPRGVWAGGYVTDTMAYVTIATTGNAIDFGDLTIGRSGAGATSGD